MGLSSGRSNRLAGAVMLMAASLSAAPKLRLVSTTVGPVTIAAGSNGPAQSVEAYNGGDGTLSLSVRSNLPWAVPSVGASRACSSRAGTCTPIQIAMNTSSLAAGANTAVVTVSDSNALDAPQTVTVTAQTGTAMPDRIDLFVAPNGSTDARVVITNSLITGRTQTQSGGAWLSFALDSAGSFGFLYPWRIYATHQPGMAEGSYNGTAVVSGSSFAGDNKTVQVSLRVTSQPIVSVSPVSLRFVLAQGAPDQLKGLAAANRGTGSLALAGVSSSAASGGSWLSAEVLQGTSVVLVTAKPGALGPGVYQGSVAVSSNAANGTQTVPVELEIVPRAGPLATYRGVVNNATFEGGEPLGQGVIAAIFGEQFLFGDPVSASSLPLGALLGGVRVLVNDQPAPVYYVSYGQINFQLPYAAPAGEATVRVERDGQRGNAVSITVGSFVPRLLRLGIGDYGIIQNASQGNSYPIPVTPGLSSGPARAGDVLTIYALGLGQTSPTVDSGVAAPAQEPLARVAPAPTVYFGADNLDKGRPITPSFVGLTPAFVGLYQINVTVPSLPANDRLNVFIENAQGVASNRVQIAVR